MAKRELKQYIIRTHTERQLNTIRSELISWGCPIKHIYKNVFFGMSVGMTNLLFKWYKDDKRIVSIEEDRQYDLYATQLNAPLHLDRLDQRNFPLSGKYTYSADGDGITAYIVDTGIVHPEPGQNFPGLDEFENRVSVLDKVGMPGVRLDPSADFLESTGKTVEFPRGWDESGHGTHVAGLIGSKTYGAAKKVLIKSAKVFTKLGSLNIAFGGDIIAGIDSVIEDFNNNSQPPSVCNMSLGTSVNFGDPETSVETAVKSMVTAGITVIVAAGNNGIDANLVSPARLSEVITVGATNSSGLSGQIDTIADFSNFGNAEDIIAPGSGFGFTESSQSNVGSVVDIFAPGVFITSTYIPSGPGDTDSTAIFSGTSMAAPLVAGVAALVLENSPLLTPTQVKTEITTNATSGIISGSLGGAPNLLLYSIFVDHAITWNTPAGGLGSVDEGFSFNLQLDASGVTGQPITYSLLSGTLPTGITLSSSGLLSGIAPTVTADTNFNFIIRASDGSVFADRSFTITVTDADLPPVWASAFDLGQVEEGQSVSLQLVAISRNGVPSSGITYSTTSTLPSGLTLDGNGNITGIAPTVINEDREFQFTITADDGIASSNRTFILTVTQRFDYLPPAEPNWLTPTGTLGTAIQNQFFSTFVQAVDEDGIPQPLTYHLSLNLDGSQFGPFGSLPPGLTLNEITGEISGTVSGLGGPGVETTFDSDTFSLDGGTTTFDAESIEIPDSFTVFDNGEFSLDGGTTTFDEELVSAGLGFEFAVYVTDGANVAARLFNINALTREPNQPPVWVTPSGSVAIVDGLDFVNVQLVATDADFGPLPIKYSILSGSLPSGLSLNQNNGVISGTVDNVSSTQSFSFLVRASDGFGFADRTFTIIVNKTNQPPEWITPAGTIRIINEGQFLNLVLLANDPDGDSVRYTLVSGSLPPNVLLNENTGLISGVIANVNADTNFTFTIRADDSLSNDLGEELYTDREFTIQVLDGALNLNKPPQWITPEGALSSGTEYEFYFFQLQALDPDNGPQSLKYNLVGGLLPNGLALNQNTGVISGFPSDVDSVDTTSNFIIRISDGLNFADRSFSITIFDADDINTPPSWITPGVPSSLGQFNELIPLVVGLQANDPDNDPLTYSIVGGSFPPGLTLDPSSGIISGTPLDVISDTVFIFTARVQDPDGAFDDRDFSIEILDVPNLPPIWITPAGSLGSFNEGTPVNIVLNATDPDVGPSSLTYNVTSGGLPPGLTLDSSTGIISGIPSPVAVDTLFNFDITVDDGLAFISRTFEIEILNVPIFLGPTTELSVALTGPLKLEWKNWNADSLIPDADLFNPADPDFGRVGVNPADEFPKILVANNLHTNDPAIVFNLFGPHHRTFNGLIGLLEFAVVRNGSGDIIYEVIFQRIIDPQKGSEFTIPSGPTPSALDTNGAETYTSYNFDHLREELLAFPNSEVLPEWMTQEQIPGDSDSIIGYIPAIVVAYVQPGTAAPLIQQLNEIQTVEITLPTVQTTFDQNDVRGEKVNPTVNIGDSLIIDGNEIFMTGTSIFDARDDINSASISGITASVVSGTEYVPGPFNGSQLLDGDVLVISYTAPQVVLSIGVGTALSDLGFTPGAKTETTFDLDTTTFNLVPENTTQVIKGPGHQFVGRQITIDRYLFEDTLGNTKWLKFFTDSLKPFWTTPGGLVATLDHSVIGIGNPITPIDLEAESPSGLGITYSIVSGELPDGLIFNTVNGDISGTITVVGTTVLPVTKYFVVRATDDNGQYVDRGFEIRVEGTSFDASSMTLDGATTSFDVT